MIFNYLINKIGWNINDSQYLVKKLRKIKRIFMIDYQYFSEENLKEMLIKYQIIVYSQSKN